MHLLYVDESGAVADPKQTYFVLAGFSLFERQGFWLANQLDAITARFDPADPAAVELHGNPMLAGKGRWRGYPKAAREQAIEDILHAFANSHPSNRLFASVDQKEYCLSPRPC